MNETGTHPWSWALGGRYPGFFSLTFTHGISVADLLARYSIDPESVQELDFSRAQTLLHPGPEEAILRVGELQGWAFGFENLGFEGSAPSRLHALSRDTETLLLVKGHSAPDKFAHWVNSEPREIFFRPVTNTLSERLTRIRSGMRRRLLVWPCSGRGPLGCDAGSG